MWDFSPLTKDWTHVPCTARQILNHWTPREIPKYLLIALEYKHCSPLLETTAPFFSFGSHNILDIEAAAQVNRELMDVLCLVQGSVFYLWSLELMEPKPGLGRTEPVSHSTFNNHKRENTAQETSRCWVLLCENEIEETVKISALRNEMFWKVVIVAELKLALPCPVPGLCKVSCALS